MPDYDNPTAAQSQNSVKSINAELFNLSPSALVTMFEIDISDILTAKKINIETDAKDLGLKNNTVGDGILRFHNNISIFNSYLVWQGKTYFPAPIQAEGFESSSKGTLPQPTLTLSSQSEEGNDQLALLKYEIRKIGDIVGAKVTRKRTFAKYLDSINFGRTQSAKIGRESTMLPAGYEPDPFAYLPSDIYFIERKQTENKTLLTYQLSSVLDLEGTKLPKRIVLADKCVWQYRGIGCWYQQPYAEDFLVIDPISKKRTCNYPKSLPSVLEKAELNTLKQNPEGGILAVGSYNVSQAKQACGLPQLTPPVATDSDENIAIAAGKSPQRDRGKYEEKAANGRILTYRPGDFVFLEKDKIKYYFLCKKTNKVNNTTEVIPPPNATYWVADECSKSLTGCRMRWGANRKEGQGVTSGPCEISKGQLPYGGFPAAKKISRLA